MYQQHIVYKILAVVVWWLWSFTALGTDNDATNLPRMALVIGNSAYQGNAYLSNPVNDAQAIAKALKKLNFTVVTLHKNLSLGAMKREITRFSLQLRKSGGVGLFYFSGHGLQDAGENYLLPVGAEDSLTYAEQLPDSAITVQWVLSTLLGARNRMNIVLIDACRNNPLRATLITDRGKGKLSGGLAATSSPPDNFIIGYAAAAGKEALNGRGSNSPYVEHLLANLQQPGLNVETVLKRVLNGVYTDTEGVQQPQYTHALRDEFVFNPSVGGNKEVPRDEPVVVAEPAPVVVVPKRKSFEPEMLSLADGCFQMGSPSTEAERGDDEQQHRVCVKAFAIGKYEVTFAEYDAFATATGRNKLDDRGWGRGQRPVINVSWEDAVAYAQWLSQQTGKNYRLPTEAEWEYAARAGTTTPFWTGNCINTDQANYDGNYDYAGCGAKTGVYRQQTVEVGSFAANPWGLYDTAGNVWEWTCSEKAPYSGKETTCANKGNSVARAVRGGSWYFKPFRVRAASRGGSAPSYRDSNLGFRLIQD